jgi:hypothetical protein
MDACGSTAAVRHGGGLVESVSRGASRGGLREQSASVAEMLPKERSAPAAAPPVGADAATHAGTALGQTGRVLREENQGLQRAAQQHR